MRLWHQKLINVLPRKQLISQHREICALRGNSWGKKHSTVDYVFNHPPEFLISFHYLIMNEMERRGYSPDSLWKDPYYRGKKCKKYKPDELSDLMFHKFPSDIPNDSISIIYPEHGDAYLQECIANLKSKGIKIKI